MSTQALKNGPRRDGVVGTWMDFCGIQFAASTKLNPNYILTDLTGWEDYEIERDTWKIPGRHGQYATLGYVSHRTIVATGWCYKEFERDWLFWQLREAFAPQFAGQGERLVRVEHMGFWTWTYGICTKFEPLNIQDNLGYDVFGWKFEIQCSNPVRYGLSPRSKTTIAASNGSTKGKPGLKFPLFGTTKNALDWGKTNASNGMHRISAKSSTLDWGYPQFYVVGEAENPVFRRESNGAVIEFQGKIAKGHILLINTHQKKAYIYKGRGNNHKQDVSWLVRYQGDFHSRPGREWSHWQYQPLFESKTSYAFVRTYGAWM